MAARQLGLQPHLLLRQHGDIVSEGKKFGNLNLKNNWKNTGVEPATSILVQLGFNMALWVLK